MSLKDLFKKAEEKAKSILGEEKVEELKGKAELAKIVGKQVLDQASETVKGEINNLKESISEEIKNGNLVDKILGGKPSEKQADEAKPAEKKKGGKKNPPKNAQ